MTWLLCSVSYAFFEGCVRLTLFRKRNSWKNLESPFQIDSVLPFRKTRNVFPRFLLQGAEKLKKYRKMTACDVIETQSLGGKNKMADNVSIVRTERKLLWSYNNTLLLIEKYSETSTMILRADFFLKPENASY